MTLCLVAVTCKVLGQYCLSSRQSKCSNCTYSTTDHVPQWQTATSLQISSPVLLPSTKHVSARPSVIRQPPRMYRTATKRRATVNSKLNGSWKGPPYFGAVHEGCLKWHLFYGARLSTIHYSRLSGALAKLQKAITLSRPPARTHGTRIALDRFSWNLIFEYFSKICLAISGFIKIWQKWRYFTWKPTYIYDNISPNSSYTEKCFRQKL